MNFYDLSTVNCNSKSFNNKAHVIVDGAKQTLISYETAVATFDNKTKTLIINGSYSKTTSRHIKEFASQNGIELKKVIAGTYTAC